MNPNNPNQHKFSPQYPYQLYAQMMGLNPSLSNLNATNAGQLMNQPIYANIESKGLNELYMPINQNQNRNALMFQNGRFPRPLDFNSMSQMSQPRMNYPMNLPFVFSQFNTPNTLQPMNYFGMTGNSQINVSTNSEVSINPLKQSDLIPKTKPISRYEPSTAPLVTDDKKKERPREREAIIIEISDSDDVQEVCMIEKPKQVIPVVEKPPAIVVPQPQSTPKVFPAQNQTPNPPIVEPPPKVSIPQLEKKTSKEFVPPKKPAKTVQQKKAPPKELKSVNSKKSVEGTEVKQVKEQEKSKMVIKIKKIAKKPSKIQLEKEKDKSWRQKRTITQEKPPVAKFSDNRGKISLGTNFQATIPQFVLNTKQFYDQTKIKGRKINERIVWCGSQNLNKYKQVKSKNPDFPPEKVIAYANNTYNGNQSTNLIEYSIQIEPELNQKENERPSMELQSKSDKMTPNIIETRITRQNLRNKTTCS